MVSQFIRNKHDVTQYLELTILEKAFPSGILIHSPLKYSWECFFFFFWNITDTYSLAIHTAVECNNCKMNPIFGLRYQLNSNADLDYCYKYITNNYNSFVLNLGIDADVTLTKEMMHFQYWGLLWIMVCKARIFLACSSPYSIIDIIEKPKRNGGDDSEAEEDLDEKPSAVIYPSFFPSVLPISLLITYNILGEETKNRSSWCRRLCLYSSS